LDGTIFKILLTERIKLQPEIGDFKMDFPQHVLEQQPETKTNNERITEGWNNIHGSNVLETYKEQKNPLPDILAKMRINYKSGGFFTIKRVKWDKEGQMFLDYQILIESVADPEQFEILTKLHEKQIEEKEMETVTEWTERALISKHLSGVGRVIQYFNSRTEHEKLNFNDPK